MEKVKIVRIITRLNIGGPAIHAILLTKGLDRDRFDTLLVTGSIDKNEGEMIYFSKDQPINDKIKVVPRMRRPISLIDDLMAFYNIFLLLKKERPLIVHTHTAKAGFLGRLAAALTGTPIKVHSFHGHVFHSYFNPLKTSVFIMIERLFARFTDRIIVVSDSIRDDISDRFKVADKTKISVIELGLDLEKFTNVYRLKTVFRKELGVDEKKVLAGIVGRLVPVKNHRLLLNAVALLKKEDPDLDIGFIIIGDGELRGELKAQATNLGIDDWIQFVGWRGDMPTVYADLDIVLLTSLNEGTPLSLIEAMASQKAIISTAVGGVPDLIDDKKTGWLIDSDNPIQLKKAILTLARDKGLRERAGKAASSNIYSRYSKERLINDIERLYKELLTKKMPRKFEEGTI
jgi:glycosyltransferase involved in cell wall biosynthesis